MSNYYTYKPCLSASPSPACPSARWKSLTCPWTHRNPNSWKHRGPVVCPSSHSCILTPTAPCAPCWQWGHPPGEVGAACSSCPRWICDPWHCSPHSSFRAGKSLPGPRTRSCTESQRRHTVLTCPQLSPVGPPHGGTLSVILDPATP